MGISSLLKHKNGNGVSPIYGTLMRISTILEALPAWQMDVTRSRRLPFIQMIISFGVSKEVHPYLVFHWMILGLNLESTYYTGKY
jgi:hypothetical protein